MISDIRLRCAVRALRGGAVIAYPTEGVWGLGCDPHNRDAVVQLLALKQRSISKGLILVAASTEQLAPYLCHLSASQHQTLEQHWPGPHTWLVPVNPFVPPWISGGQQTLALRVSAHPVVRALCEGFGGPIVSTSANISGHAAPTTGLAVQLRFPSLVRMPGKLTEAGKPSTIQDLQTGKRVRP